MISEVTYVSEDLKNKQCTKSNYIYLHQKQTFRKYILKEDVISNYSQNQAIPRNISFTKTCARSIWKKLDYGFEDMKQNFKNIHALQTQYQNYVNFLQITL